MQLMQRGPEDMNTTHRHFFPAGIVSSLMWDIQYMDGV